MEHMGAMVQMASLICFTFITLLGCFSLAWGITHFIRRTIKEYKCRKSDERASQVYTQVHDLRRWCRAEFPQIEFMADELLKYLRGEVSYIDASQFRDKLRNQFNHKPQKDIQGNG